MMMMIMGLAPRSISEISALREGYGWLAVKRLVWEENEVTGGLRSWLTK